MIDHFAKQANKLNYLDSVEAIDLDIEALINFNKIKKFNLTHLTKFLQMFDSETRYLYSRHGKHRALLKIDQKVCEKARQEQRRAKKARDLPEEIWKKHHLYSITISSMGRIKDRNGKIVGKKGMVNIGIHKKRIERLVAQVFIGPISDHDVEFKDGNRLNFKINNLFLKKGFTRKK